MLILVKIFTNPEHDSHTSVTVLVKFNAGTIAMPKVYRCNI